MELFWSLPAVERYFLRTDVPLQVYATNDAAVLELDYLFLFESQTELCYDLILDRLKTAFRRFDFISRRQILVTSRGCRPRPGDEDDNKMVIKHETPQPNPKIRR